jgi:tRNA(fMet)-specific endonuclease VapC
MRSKNRSSNVAEVLKFLSLFRSLPFDDVAADRYAEIRADLESKGIPIGPNDLMIASIAMAHGLIAVTNNVAEFSRVVGLKIEDWH